MKTKPNILPIRIMSILAACAFLAGCSKQEEAPATVQSERPPAPPAAAQEIRDTAASTATQVQKQAVEAAGTAENAVSNATQAAVEQVKPAATAVPPAPGANPQAQTILEQVRSLVAEKKYPEALAALSQISRADLPSEQQKLVDQLRAQINNAMANQTANEGLKAVGGLLERKK